MNMPGFTAEASLGPTKRVYRSQPSASSPSEDSQRVVSQFRFPATSDPDIGAYLRCRQNGGGDLVCRFFGGLPPFTIGGLLF